MIVFVFINTYLYYFDYIQTFIYFIMYIKKTNIVNPRFNCKFISYLFVIIIKLRHSYVRMMTCQVSISLLICLL